MDEIKTEIALMKQSVTNLDGHFKTHIEDDKVSFKSIGDKMDELKKHVYIGIGILVAVQYLLK